MRRPHRLIPQRRRLFVGCEGESEQSYVALLARFAEAARVSVHLDAVLLRPGGGDPLAIVERAAAKVDERVGRHGAYERRFVLIDRDRWGQTPNRDQQIAGLAVSASLELIWQRPCHEAVLLRHLDGCSQLRPRSTAIAQTGLSARWPSYQKGMPAIRLADRLDIAAVQRAAAVEPELAVLLHEIGLA